MENNTYPIVRQFNYTWNSGESFVNIPFVRRPFSIDIQRDGIRNAYDVHIEDSDSWVCNGSRMVPDTALTLR